MRYVLFLLRAVALLALLGPLAAAQETTAPNPARRDAEQKIEQSDHPVVFRVNVVQRSMPAVNYRYRSGATHVDFRGTDLMPRGEGHARVQSSAGKIDIAASVKHLQPASFFGPEYLTYVLWAVTPEGRSANLGELFTNHDGDGDLHATTDLQIFGLMVTAEPYFAVTQPSNLVVLENVVRADTLGGEHPISAKFDALERGTYVVNVPADQLPATSADRKRIPLEMLEAMNAVAIARASGAEQWAPDALGKAQAFLDQGTEYLRRKQGTTPVGSVARSAAEEAEDARVLSIRAAHEHEVAEERRLQQEREDAAHAKAEEEAERARRAQEQAAASEQQRLAAEKAQADADRARQQAELAAQQAAAERQQADAARAAALQQQQVLAQQADAARAAQQQAEQDRERLRARLVAQLNQVLTTRDTARGIVMSMPDVLFGFNQSTLKPEARERLAKVSGILLGYPDLKLRIEGYTDSVGSDQYNQVLSEKRAGAVRDYLVSQGVSLDNVVAEGRGKNDPVASNNTSEGRQLNRRVELVVNGESLGFYSQPAGGAGPQSPAPPPAAPPRP